MGKEVRIYTSFSDASDGCCRVRSLVPLLVTIWVSTRRERVVTCVTNLLDFSINLVDFSINLLDFSINLLDFSINLLDFSISPANDVSVLWRADGRCGYSDFLPLSSMSSVQAQVILYF